MAHGLEDFTLRGDIDITAQTIGDIAVDIAAQTLANLSVDIAAQTLANLSVDIAAQTLATLGINITAQDLAELVINIHAQDVGVYLQPEWAAKEGTDKTLVGSGTGKTFQEFASIVYTPTAPKTLYITAIGYNCQIENAADADHFAHVIVAIFVEGGTVFTTGGMTGGALVLPRPIVVPGDVALLGTVINNCNVDCALALVLLGYEV